MGAAAEIGKLAGELARQRFNHILLINMQIATIISLAGTVTCIGLFSKQKNWLLAAAFSIATVYTVLEKVIHISLVPAFLIPWCAYLFFALVCYEIFRAVVLK